MDRIRLAQALGGDGPASRHGTTQFRAPAPQKRPPKSATTKQHANRRKGARAQGSRLAQRSAKVRHGHE